MAWAWLGSGGIGVDVFMPASGALDEAIDLGAVPGLRTENNGPHWPIRPTHPGGPDVPQANDIPDPAQPAAAPDGPPDGMYRAWTVDDAIEQAHGETRRVSGALYQTAGDDIGTMFGTPIRGRWMPADLAGPARHEVFLGLLASLLEHPSGRAAAREARSRPTPASKPAPPTGWSPR